MGRNEIRLRRQKMSSGRIAQHRNYGDLMARHERDIKIKRVLRVFLYFLIIVFIVILSMMVRRWSNRKPGKDKATTDVTRVDQSSNLSSIL